MLFSSSVFLLSFLAITLLIYFLVPSKFVMLKNIVLLIASLVFYGWGEPKYILVMLFSILANYVLALLVGKYVGEGKKKAAKWILVLDIVVNLAILGFFKYTDFILETINSLAGSGFGLIGIALPIGISFYTFQTMSYVIDVYWGKVKAQKNIIILATYITLFPQLIAGPIVRYSDVERDLQRKRGSAEQIAAGIRRFVIGFSKKVLIANQVALIWDEMVARIGAGDDLSVVSAWLGAIAFTLQIYFDFSGYSDMAIGLGKIFGFEYLENFDYPYISKSITEFWRRWHMSLSSWFKEYVYIPLGGNRKGLLRQIVNIAIVWALTGLWHGASWNFVLWGVYYGILLILEKIFLLKVLDKCPNFLRHIYALILIVFGWVIFNITDFQSLGQYIGYMFGQGHIFIDDVAKYQLLTKPILLAIGIIGSTPLIKKLALIFEALMEKRQVALGAIEAILLCILFMLSISFVVSGSYNPFLYFRF